MSTLTPQECKLRHQNKRFIMMYCLDANIFLTPWNEIYPMDIFPSLWKKLAVNKQHLVIPKPIFNEIDPIAPHHKKLTNTHLEQIYPLRMWLEQTGFTVREINTQDENCAIELRKTYEVEKNSKGIGHNDTLLIAYAHRTKNTIVTYEKFQENNPSKKKNFKIPLVCKIEKIECISFVDMIKKLGIKL